MSDLLPFKEQSENTYNVRTMDSRDIAELTGKNHGDVGRDIRNMLEKLEADESRFASVYKGGNGENRRCYKLPYRETMILVSGYSVELRAKVIDRWMELEKAEAMRAFAIPKTYAEALRIAADQAQKIEEQAAALAIAEPKAAITDAISNAEGLKTFAEVGKITGLGPRKIINILVKASVLFYKGTTLLPRQEHIDAKRFVVREKTFKICETEHLYSQTYITGKGEVWIAEKFCKVE
jgi:phage antirepressor YoqD-like protein